MFWKSVYDTVTISHNIVKVIEDYRTDNVIQHGYDVLT